MRIANPEKHPRLSLYLRGEMKQLGYNLTEITVDKDVTVQVRAMVAPTIDPTIWIEGLMREHLPPAARLEPVSVAPTVSEHGWPVVFAHYRIFDQAGHPLEERAGAFYRIVHNNAEVLARLRNGVRWSDREATLKPEMMSAHVNWPHYEHDLLYTLLGFQL
jgi:hypothetical protein